MGHRWGGHLKPGEACLDGHDRVIAPVADWEWEHGGVVRREVDYVVEVDGDLAAPRLEKGKHDAYAWVGLDNIQLMAEGFGDKDDKMKRNVERALRHYAATGTWHGVIRQA